MKDVDMSLSIMEIMALILRKCKTVLGFVLAGMVLLTSFGVGKQVQSNRAISASVAVAETEPEESEVSKWTVRAAAESTEGETTLYTVEMYTPTTTVQEVQEINPVTWKTCVLYLVLGAFAGFFLGGLWVCCRSLFMAYLDNNRRLEDCTEIPFLGSLALPTKPGERLAQWLEGKTEPQDQESAMSCLKTAAAFNLKGTEKVLLVSTLPEKVIQSELWVVKDALTEIGCVVTCEAACNGNPSALEALINCDTVILAERVDASSLRNILSFLCRARQAERPVSGYVMI